MPCNALKIRCYTANTNSLPLTWVLPNPVLVEKRLLQSVSVLFRPISCPPSLQNNFDSLRKETLIFKEDISLQVHLINHCGLLPPSSSLLLAMLHALVQRPISLPNSITCLHKYSQYDLWNWSPGDKHGATSPFLRRNPAVEESSHLQTPPDSRKHQPHCSGLPTEGTFLAINLA